MSSAQNCSFLLWIRTKRRLDTYADDAIDDLTHRLNHPDRFTNIEVDEPFGGDDQLLYHIEFLDGIRKLDALLEPAMRDDMVSDWSLTKIGATFCKLHDDDIEVDADGEKWFPSQYLHPFEGYGAALLDWSLTDMTSNSAVLWLDLDRERLDPRDAEIDRVARALPGEVHRMWQGRSSIALGFTSRPERDDAAGHEAKTLLLIKSLELGSFSDWLLFQVGNESVGGVIEGINQMHKFIWRKPPSRSAPSNRNRTESHH
jgi:hypothetical protein